MAHISPFRAGVLSALVTVATWSAPGFAQTGAVEVESVPLDARSPAGAALFTRQQGYEVGIDLVNDMSPAEFFPPYWNGRGLAAGDVDRDGRPDLVAASRHGVHLYLNRGQWRFEKKALNLPKLRMMSAHVVALVDMDNDGWQDLVITTYATGNYLVRNQAGHFRSNDVTALPGSPKVLSKALSFGDLDADGDLDVVLGNWFYGYAKQFPSAEGLNRILRNETGKRFAVRDLPEIPADTLSVLISDFDLDGHQDLIIGNDFGPPDYFYVGDGKGRLSLLHPSEGRITVSTNTTMSIDTADIDNDLDLDIYIAQIAAGATGPSAQIRLRGFDRYCEDLQRENERKACEETARQRLFFEFGARHQPKRIELCKRIEDRAERRECAAMMILLTAVRAKRPDLCDRIPADIGKVNFTCKAYFDPSVHGTQEDYARTARSILNENVLLEAVGEGRFENVARSFGVETTGWSWNARFADFDNDEWQDLFVVNGTWLRTVGTPSKFYFQNQQGQRFEEKTDEVGLQNYMLQSAYVMDDFDNDGDLDIIANSTSGPLWVYRNNEQSRHSLIVQLEDRRANRDCVGCKVIISYGPGGEKKQIREIKSGGGFLSFDRPYVHFGLGEHTQAASLEVQWSTGEKTAVDGPFDSRSRYLIRRR